MSLLGALATWSALALGAWAFIAALAASVARPQLQRSAERALLMSGAFAAAAAALLSILLVRGEMSVSYVARSIAQNLPPPYRLGALLSAPAGGTLVTAALVAVLGFVATRRRRAPFGISASGATIVALLASSVAASPFAILPWLPAEGLGMPPALQQPEALLARLALSLGVGLLAAAVAATADSLDETVAPLSGRAAEPWLRGALAILALAALLAGEAAVATGDTSGVAPLAAWRGVLVPSFVGVILAWRTARGVAAPQRVIVAALSALGLTTVALVGTGGGSAGAMIRGVFVATCLLLCGWGAVPMVRDAMLAGRARVALSLGVLLLLAAGGWAVVTGTLSPVTGAELHPAVIWLLVVGAALLSPGPGNRAGNPDERRRGAESLFVAGALASLVLAALGAAMMVTSTVALASGSTTTLRPRLGGEVELAHQGVSRFEAANSHVVAIAAELTRGGSPRLLSPERREYVDSRDVPIGDPIARPGIVRGLLDETRVSIVDVAADDAVTLRVQVVPFALAWRLAALLLVFGAIAPLIVRVQRHIPTPIGDPVAP